MGMRMMTQLGMGMGRNGNHHVWEGNGNGPYSHGNKFPSADAVFSLCNSNRQYIIIMVGYEDMTILLLMTICST